MHTTHQDGALRDAVGDLALRLLGVAELYDLPDEAVAAMADEIRDVLAAAVGGQRRHGREALSALARELGGSARLSP